MGFGSWNSWCGMIFIPLLFNLWEISNGKVVSLDNSNVDSILQNADVVLVNFHADWCRFSQMLTPIFEQASDRFNDNPKVVFGSVDCDRQVDIASKYAISKYPTLKYFRYGQVAKREYRGQRSVDAFVEFINKQLEPAFIELTDMADVEKNIHDKKGTIIAYFREREGSEWRNLQQIAANMREDCQFLIGSGEKFKQQTLSGNNVAYRKPKGDLTDEQVFSGDLSNEEYVRQWIADKCVPLVREITFENAEELTEEGLPFLILFHKPEDTAVLEKYTQEVTRQLGDMKRGVKNLLDALSSREKTGSYAIQPQGNNIVDTINCLYADGRKFAHPLHHLGKSEQDLPVLAIDSFRHMYVFPDTKQMGQGNKMREFVQDLNSGKLHREFHHGPDPTTQPPQEQPKPGKQGGAAKQPPPPSPPKTTPPESAFKKLKPQDTRYTLLKDEL